jgi:hypothetical protein
VGLREFEPLCSTRRRVENLAAVKEFLVATAAAAAVWGLGYYILVRRLYAVTRPYIRSALSDTGRAISLTVLNRGHRAETDIKLELDPARVYTLLAISSDDISQVGSDVQVSRLPPRSTVEAIVLVEGGDFGKDKILRLTSKDAGGKAFDKLEDVPQPPGAIPLVLSILLLLTGGFAYFAYQIGSENSTMSPSTSPFEPTAEQKAGADALRAGGWSNVDEFVKAPMSKAYGTGQLPVAITPLVRVDDFVSLKIAMRNNLDGWLTVTVKLTTPTQIDRTDCRRQVIDEYLGDSIVLPHSDKSADLVVYVPRNARAEAQKVLASVTLTDARSRVYNINRYIDVSQVPERTVPSAKGGAKPTCPMK